MRRFWASEQLSLLEPRNPELGYQTQYTDPTTGDTLMQSRWYSAGTGTFRSRDTYAGDLNTPVSLNRYTYGANNPIRYWDPSGRCVESISFNADGTIDVVPMRGAECNPLDASPGGGLEGTKVREEYGPNGAPGSSPRRGEAIQVGGATWDTDTTCTVGAYWCGFVTSGVEAVIAPWVAADAFIEDPVAFSKNIGSQAISLAMECTTSTSCGMYLATEYVASTSALAEGHGWAYAIGAATFDVASIATGAASASRTAATNAARQIDLPPPRLATFHTVQSVADEARLNAGGNPWPVTDTRAQFGPGVYAWGSASEAQVYAARLGSRGVCGLRICEFSVYTSGLSRLDVDSLANPGAFMEKHSALYGGTPNHGFDYITRGTQFGTEHFFGAGIFNRLSFGGPR